MSSDKCESCPYATSDLVALHKHWQEAGHAGSSEASEARSERSATIKGVVMGAVGASLAVAGAAFFGRKVELRSLMSKLGRLESINNLQAAEIIKLLAENTILKSAGGAGKALRSYRG
ncbi:hypothetical protein ACIQF6_14985 [Kitasatospora sp. NPDC092948]|uniref:hypothetical protein n=1 Tax=Kitasatospora sp. NPDC092948 TaxID=3364088 RepID=UPI003808801A